MERDTKILLKSKMKDHSYLVRTGILLKTFPVLSSTFPVAVLLRMRYTPNPVTRG